MPPTWIPPRPPLAVIATDRQWSDAMIAAARRGMLSVNEVRMSLAGIEGLRPASHASKCGYCGRYGAPLSQCAGCGAQVGPASPSPVRLNDTYTSVIDVTHLRSPDGVREFIRVPGQSPGSEIIHK